MRAPTLNRAAGTAVLISYLFLLFYTVTFYVSFPFADHLDLLILLDKYFDHNLAVADFFAPHGASHWHTGAYLLLVPLALLTSWNTAYEVLFNVLFGTAAFLFLFRQLRSTAERMESDKWLPLTLISVAFIMFSIDPYDNWLWGWQVSVQMCLFGVVAGIVVLCAKDLSAGKLVLAVMLGCLATYNFSTALCYWPIGFMLLLLRPWTEVRRRIVFTISWLACSLLIAVHYYVTFIDVIRLTQKPAPLLDRILFAGAFVVTYLGCGLARFTENGYVVGVVGAAGIAFFLRLLWILHMKHARPLQDLLPYIALAVFAMGAGFVTGLGRMDLGLKQSAVFRYISFSNLFWLTIAALSWMSLLQGTKRRSWRAFGPEGILLLLVLVLKIANQGYVFSVTRERQAEMTRLAADIVAYYPNYEGTDMNFKLLYFSKPVAMEYLRSLHDHKLSVFSRRTGS